MNFIYRFYRFMNGRYGFDELGSFLFKIYFLALLVNIFVRNYIVSVVEILIVIVIVFRFLSKNIRKRRLENEGFLKLKKGFLRPFGCLFRNISDRDNVYKRCRKCHKTLKLPLPLERGIKSVKCPNCGNRMKILVLRQQKIEIIKGSDNNA